MRDKAQLEMKQYAGKCTNKFVYEKDAKGAYLTCESSKREI